MLNHESMAAGYDTSIDVLTKMRLGVEFRHPVRIRDFEVTLRPLSMAETIEVMSTISSEMKRAPEAFRNKINENALIAKEHLVLASTSYPGAGDPKLTHALLNLFSPDEIIALFKEYTTITEKVDPSVETMPAEDLRVLVDTLKKSSREDQESILTALSFWQMKDVLLSLINED